MSIDIKYPVSSKPVLHSYHAHPNQSRWLYGSKARIGCSDAIAPAEIPSRITWKVYRFEPYRAVKTNKITVFFFTLYRAFHESTHYPKSQHFYIVRSKVRSWVVMLGLVRWHKPLLLTFSTTHTETKPLLPSQALLVHCDCPKMSLCLKPIIHMQ